MIIGARFSPETVSVLEAKRTSLFKLSFLTVPVLEYEVAEMCLNEADFSDIIEYVEENRMRWRDLIISYASDRVKFNADHLQGGADAARLLADAVTQHLASTMAGVIPYEIRSRLYTTPRDLNPHLIDHFSQETPCDVVPAADEDDIHDKIASKC
ncbi:hypothetical protein E8E11_000204 [Didymella keratinophila]|nr:hypothetical protein E8E11_000204 [Didymella keratinophila]